jgi:hypothetical protein
MATYQGRDISLALLPSFFSSPKHQPRGSDLMQGIRVIGILRFH